MARLRADLNSGAWAHRHAGLLDRYSMDYGYRLIIAGEAPGLPAPHPRG
jgi:hypothetical protein